MGRVDRRRRMAYTSTASGPSHVFITGYPDGRGKWAISTAGGTEPRWAPDGRELYYQAPDRAEENTGCGDGRGQGLDGGRQEAMSAPTERRDGTARRAGPPLTRTSRIGTAPLTSEA